MKKLGLIVLVTHLLGGAAAAQSGATYYVATNGNDGNSCSQAQSAFTPKRSLNNAVTCLKPGGTLLVRGGTYGEALVQPPLFGTSWSNKIRIAAYPGEKVWLKPAAGPSWILDFQSGQTYVEFDGINLDATNATQQFLMGGIGIYGSTYSTPPAHHIRFQNAEILMKGGLSGDLGSSRVGIMLNGEEIGFNEILHVTIHGGSGPNSSYGMYVHSSDNVMDGLNIYDMGMMAIQVYDSIANPARNIFRNSTFHDITTGYETYRVGLLIMGDNNQIYNNIFYNINADGSASAPSSALVVYRGTNNQLLNNTIANNRGSAISTNPGVAGTLIANNIAYGNDFDGITDSGTGTILGPNDFGADPRFVNAPQGNFQLQPVSLAIDAGTTYSIVSTDATGVQRPQGGAYDLGAYELASVPLPPQAPTGVQVTQTAQ